MFLRALGNQPSQERCAKSKAGVDWSQAGKRSETRKTVELALVLPVSPFLAWPPVSRHLLRGGHLGLPESVAITFSTVGYAAELKIMRVSSGSQMRGHLEKGLGSAPTAGVTRPLAGWASWSGVNPVRHKAEVRAWRIPLSFSERAGLPLRVAGTAVVAAWVGWVGVAEFAEFHGFPSAWSLAQTEHWAWPWSSLRAAVSVV